MKVKKTARAVGKGLLWALVPMAAWHRVRETKQSWQRIAEMTRRGKYVPRPEEITEHQASQMELADAGREIVLQMEEHERFEYIAAELGFDDEAVEEKKHALARSHAIRLCILIFTAISTVGLGLIFGLIPVVFGSAACMYLTASCVKTTCLYIQLEDRALWTMATVTRREGFWRRVLWFLE